MQAALQAVDLAVRGSRGTVGIVCRCAATKSRLARSLVHNFSEFYDTFLTIHQSEQRLPLQTNAEKKNIGETDQESITADEAKRAVAGVAKESIEGNTEK